MSRSRSLTLAVFIDALGAEVAERHGFLKGHLKTRARVDTVLGYSCTCVPTILTGRMPEEHGHFSFFRFDPERSPFRGMAWMRHLPKTLTSRARVRNVLSKAVGSYLGFNGYFNLYNVPFDRLPYLDYTERKDLYEKGGIIEGQDTIFDRLREERIDFVLADWRQSEAANTAAVAKAIESGKWTLLTSTWRGSTGSCTWRARTMRRRPPISARMSRPSFGSSTSRRSTTTRFGSRSSRTTE